MEMQCVFYNERLHVLFLCCINCTYMIVLLVMCYSYTLYHLHTRTSFHCDHANTINILNIIIIIPVKIMSP